MPKESYRRYVEAVTKWMDRTPLEHCLLRSKDCSESIVRSHTVQNSTILDQICEEGHVFQLKQDPYESGVQFRRIGRRRASTFSGLCAHHDAKMFERIDVREASELDLSDPECVALLSIRAIAREYWAKLNGMALTRRLAQLYRVHDFEEIARVLNVPSAMISTRPELHEEHSASVRSMQEAAARGRRSFEALLTMLRRKRFHQLRWDVFYFETRSGMAVSASGSPEVDFAGVRFADYRTQRYLPDITIHVVPDESTTSICLSYHNRDRHALGPLGVQLRQMSKEEQRRNLSWFILANCENMVFRPSFVGRMPTGLRDLVRSFFVETAFLPPEYDSLPPLDLLDDSSLRSGE